MFRILLEKKFRDDFNKIQATASNHQIYSPNTTNNSSNLNNMSNPSSPMHSAGQNNISSPSASNMHSSGQHIPTTHRIHVPNTCRYDILLKQRHVQVRFIIFLVFK